MTHLLKSLIWGGFFMLAFYSSCTSEPVDPPSPGGGGGGGGGVEPVVQGDTFLLLPPEEGYIYHSAFPNLGGTEDAVSNTKIQVFENLVGKEMTWVYFSNNWFSNISFPTAKVNKIRDAGRLPFIRMMPRSNFNTGAVDPQYSMQSFLSGEHDEALKNWALAAKAIEGPLLVEFGTEVNGNWFPWNAEFNGGSSRTGYGDPNLFDGMERFRDVYRHIIDICREQGVNNITWFYHVNAYSGPDESWNNMQDYYPGDDYIDWLGVSIYGPQETYYPWQTFEEILDNTYADIDAITNKDLPLAVLEWGVIDYPDVGDKAQWITDALATISEGGAYAGKVQAVSYWHENFGNTNLKIDSSPESLEAYRTAIAGPQFISTPIIKE